MAKYIRFKGGVIKLRDEELGIDDMKDYLDYQEYLRSDDYLGWQYEKSDR